MNACKLIVKSIAPKVNVICDENDYTCFDHDLKTVIIGGDLNNDYGFMRHLKYNHNFPEAYDYSIKLWSILHELGHYFEGNDGIIDEEEMTQRAICSLIPNEMAKDNPYIQNLYFNLQSEYDATEWAITWVMKHKRLAKIFNALVK